MAHQLHLVLRKAWLLLLPDRSSFSSGRALLRSSGAPRRITVVSVSRSGLWCWRSSLAWRFVRISLVVPKPAIGTIWISAMARLRLGDWWCRAALVLISSSKVGSQWGGTATTDWGLVERDLAWFLEEYHVLGFYFATELDLEYSGLWWLDILFSTHSFGCCRRYYYILLFRYIHSLHHTRITTNRDDHYITFFGQHFFELR